MFPWIDEARARLDRIEKLLKRMLIALEAIAITLEETHGKDK